MSQMKVVASKSTGRLSLGCDATEKGARRGGEIGRETGREGRSESPNGRARPRGRRR